jgi:1-phosphatidylinositol phosphodiesterase
MLMYCCIVYHGPRSQRSNLTVLLETLHQFLRTHPTETFIVSIKQETPPDYPRFSQILYKAFQPYLDEYWFVEERVPLLGEVRGRGILLCRFDKSGEGDWEEGLGLKPYIWPDSRKEGFEWSCKDVTVRIQDWWVTQNTVHRVIAEIQQVPCTEFLADT